MIMSTKKAIFILVLLFLSSLLLSICIVIIYIKKVRTPSKQFPDKTNLIREPAVAGGFYPEDSKELSEAVDRFLKQSEYLPAEGKLKILIVPHAGLEYSGRVAGAGFKQIEKEDFENVILLGASHRSYHNTVAIYGQGSWKTPLGSTPVNEDLSQKLLDNDKKIVFDNAPHKEEHSLEVELIFLQSFLKSFKIVPVLIGQVTEESLNLLAKKIAENLDEKTLLVISSDFSHYPSWETANKVDEKTINSILTGKTENFEKSVADSENQHYPNLDTCACGHNPIKVSLKVAEILNIVDFKKIKYENSGDITKDKSRVVGYAAIGAWSKNNNQTLFLDKNAEEEALTLARETLVKYLSGPNSPNSHNSPKSPELLKPLGAFVTLRKNSQLRGCIGEFEPKEPLYQVIQKMAIAAATEDPRFNPVTKDELKDIKIEISVMTPRQKISDWQKIVLGKHGVVVQSDFRSGTFLPQVATETGWGLEEFLSQLCSQKAGLPANCYKDPKIKLYTFEVQILEEK